MRLHLLLLWNHLCVRTSICLPPKITMLKCNVSVHAIANVLHPLSNLSPHPRDKKQINNTTLPTREHVDHDEYKDINKERERINNITVGFFGGKGRSSARLVVRLRFIKKKKRCTNTWVGLQYAIFCLIGIIPPSHSDNRTTHPP